MQTLSTTQLFANRIITIGSSIVTTDFPVITIVAGYEYRHKFTGFASAPFTGTIAVESRNNSFMYNVETIVIPINVASPGAFVIPMTLQHERFVNKLDITIKLNRQIGVTYTVSMDLNIVQV